jgi:hypothetical protein
MGMALGFTFDARTSPVNITGTGTNVVAKATAGTLAGVSVNTGGAGSIVLIDCGVTPNVTLATIDTTAARSVNLYYLRFSKLCYTKTGTADVTLALT